MINLFSNAGTLGRSGSISPKILYITVHHSKSTRVLLRKTKTSSTSISVDLSLILMSTGFRLQATICDLPWVTSIFYHSDSHLPAIHRDLLFIKSTYYHMDLITFAKKIQLKLNSFSTYIFTDAGGMYLGPDRLGNNARVLVSFVAPSGKSLILRLKHSGRKDGPLEVTLGSQKNKIQLNPSAKSESSLMIDDITLCQISGPSESDHLSFEPGIRNDIFIQFRGMVFSDGHIEHGHFLHDVELLDEAGLKHPRNKL